MKPVFVLISIILTVSLGVSYGSDKSLSFEIVEGSVASLSYNVHCVVYDDEGAVSKDFKNVMTNTKFSVFLGDGLHGTQCTFTVICERNDPNYYQCVQYSGNNVSNIYFKLENNTIGQFYFCETAQAKGGLFGLPSSSSPTKNADGGWDVIIVPNTC